MIYVVLEGLQILGFPNAKAAKPSGNGYVVHIIGADDAIVGNFPMRGVRYYGSELPPIYEERYKEQVRWAGLTEAEREAEREAAKKRREGQP